LGIDDRNRAAESKAGVPAAEAQGGTQAGPVLVCSHIRSTLLVGSLKALRDRGHGDRYRAHVGAAFYERILTMGAPAWLEIGIAETHYSACDALGLSATEIMQIGAAVVPVQVSGIDVVFRAARIGGANPWTVLHNARRYWSRMYEGSSIVVLEKGPKDAHVEISAQPLARSNYWRTGLRGILQTLGNALSEKAYVRELPRTASDTAKYALAWV
jgi:hypothetical protein